MRREAGVYAGAAALGAMSGMRAMSAPALLTRFARKRQLAIEGSGLGFLNSGGAASTTALLALGEFVANKAPSIPSGTGPGPLLTRAVAGAVSGAVLCSGRKRSAWLGALFGAAGAVGAAYAVYHLRRAATERLHIPTQLVGLAEDALVATGAMLVTSEFAEEAG